MNAPKVEIISDGTAPGTQILVDDKPLPNVVALSVDLSVDTLARAVVELDWVGLHYTGPGERRVRYPTTRDVVAWWWRGLKEKRRAG